MTTARGRREGATVALLLLLTAAPFARSCAAGEVLVNGDWLAHHFEPFRSAGRGTRAANAELEDPILSTYPLKTAAASTLARGSMPLWNPWIAGGMPFFGDSISTPLHPFNAALVLGGPGIGWNIFLWLPLALAGVGSYFLLRALGVGPAGALVGATCYAIGGHHIVWLEYGTLVAGHAFLPLALYAVERRLAGGGHRHSLLLVACSALQAYSGNIQANGYFVGFVLIYAVLRSVRRPGGLRRTIETAICLAAGLALAAPQIFATVELAAESYRPQSKYLGVNHMHPATLLTLLSPDLFGSPVGDTNIGRFITGQPYEHVLVGYLGAFGLALAVVGALRPGLGPRLPLFLAALGIPLLLVVLHSDFVREQVGRIWGSFHSFDWKRTRYFAVFGMAVFAGWGIDGCLTQPALRRRAVVASAVLLASLVAVFLAIDVMSGAAPAPAGFLGYFSHLREEHGSVLGAPAVIRPLALLLVGTALLWLLHRGRLSAHVVAALTIAVVAIDLLTWGLPYNPSVPPRLVSARVPLIARARALVARERSRARVAAVTQVFGLPSWEVNEREGDVLPPNTLLPYGLEDPRSFSTFYLDRYLEMMEVSEGRRDPFPFSVQLTRPSTPVLDLWSVRYVFGTGTLHGAGLREIGRSRGLRLYERETALPRAFHITGCRSLGSRRAVRRAMEREDFDPRAAVLLEGGGCGAPRSATLRPARIVEHEPERVVIAVDATHDGFLVLADAYAAGWEATVDGRAARIQPAYLALRAVRVPEGRHRVVFLYRPRGVRTGVLVAGSTAVAIAALGWIIRRRGAAGSRARGG
ncbi:MAG: YfhO family protein [Deltaproteobacteria bacterium]|nr:YfhO family protein [Deltaproteobacteria bacterium]